MNKIEKAKKTEHGIIHSHGLVWQETLNNLPQSRSRRNFFCVGHSSTGHDVLWYNYPQSWVEVEASTKTMWCGGGMMLVPGVFVTMKKGEVVDMRPNSNPSVPRENMAWLPFQANKPLHADSQGRAISY